MLGAGQVQAGTQVAARLMGRGAQLAAAASVASGAADVVSWGHPCSCPSLLEKMPGTEFPAFPPINTCLGNYTKIFFAGKTRTHRSIIDTSCIRIPVLLKGVGYELTESGERAHTNT